MRWRVLACLLWLAYAPAALPGAATPTPGADMPAFEDVELQRRYVSLLRELRCMVCQNESLAESKAGLARDLRRAVHEQIAAGRSDAEILAYMSERYGDFVRYRPPVRPATYALWYGPPALLLVGAATLVGMTVRRNRRAGARARPLSEAERRRAAALLDETRDGGPGP
jgi:cytochrome c-type biogenesis protein CcmH